LNVLSSAALRPGGLTEVSRPDPLLLARDRPLHVAHTPAGLTIAIVSVHWLRGQPGHRLEAMAIRHLSAEERAHARTLRLPKRRMEWLGGRLAAKHAVRAHRRRHAGAVVPTRQVRVTPVAAGPQAGKPFVNAPVGIGISHSADFAVAACGLGPVGIDVELDRPLPSALVKTLAADNGGAAMPATLRWSCKEAVLKYFGFGMRLDGREVRLTGWQADGAFTWGPGPQLSDAAAGMTWPRNGWAGVVGGYSLALVW
jgi:4'-phosphopantetheinyl transferase